MSDNTDVIRCTINGIDNSSIRLICGDLFLIHLNSLWIVVKRNAIKTKLSRSKSASNDFKVTCSSDDIDKLSEWPSEFKLEFEHDSSVYPDTLSFNTKNNVRVLVPKKYFNSNEFTLNRNDSTDKVEYIITSCSSIPNGLHISIPINEFIKINGI